jgi:hypothetical protein
MKHRDLPFIPVLGYFVDRLRDRATTGIGHTFPVLFEQLKDNSGALGVEDLAA